MSNIETQVGLHLRLRGMIRVQVLRDGEVREDTGWFPNLITNLGLDMLGDNQGHHYGAATADLSVVGRCTVGTGTTPPAFTDTALVTPLAYTGTALGTSSNTSPYYSTSYVTGPPDYIQAVGIHTFAVGAVVGNISEIGFGGLDSSSSTQLSLFSRQLIQVGGSPGTISVTSADQLVVTYSLQYYLNLTDTAYSGLVISGTTYSGTIRAANSTNLSSIYPFEPVDASSVYLGYNPTINISGYAGALGPVTGVPSGANTGVRAVAPTAAYSPGSYAKSYTLSYTTAQGNITGGIAAWLISCNMAAWQISVSPALSKDNTKTLTATFTISWARYP